MITDERMKEIKRMVPPGSTITRGKYFIYVELPFQKRLRKEHERQNRKDNK